MQSTPSRVSTSIAAGGARKKNGFHGSGHGSPRSEMQHSRLSTKTSASCATATTSSATSESGPCSRIASATFRPSIVSPASASFTRRASMDEQDVASGSASDRLVDWLCEQAFYEAVRPAADDDQVRVALLRDIQQPLGGRAQFRDVLGLDASAHQRHPCALELEPGKLLRPGRLRALGE